MTRLPKRAKDAEASNPVLVKELEDLKALALNYENTRTPEAKKLVDTFKKDLSRLKEERASAIENLENVRTPLPI